MQSIVWFAAGPGTREALLDSIESVIASDGDDARQEERVQKAERERPPGTASN